MSGWIKLHRSILKWGWYSDPVCRALFIHLLLLSNHEPNKWMGVHIAEGECPVGRKELGIALGFSEQKIRTALSRLKLTSEITSRKYNKFSVITIVNWKDYQSSNQQNNQQLTSDQPATNQQLTTLKEEKKKEIRTPLPPVGEFDAFWALFPPQRKGDKGKALRAWNGAIKKSSPDEIKAGLEKYVASDEVARGFAKGAAAWLNDSRWTSQYKPIPKQRGPALC